MGEGGRLESSALPSRDCWHKVIRTPSSLASPRPSPPATLRGPGSPTIVCFSRLCPLAARAQPRRQATSTRCRLGVHPHLGPRSFAVAAPSNALVPPFCPAVSTRKRKSAYLFIVSCAPSPACPLSTHPCRGPVAHTAPLPQNASARPVFPSFLRCGARKAGSLRPRPLLAWATRPRSVYHDCTRRLCTGRPALYFLTVDDVRAGSMLDTPYRR